MRRWVRAEQAVFERVGVEIAALRVDGRSDQHPDRLLLLGFIVPIAAGVLAWLLVVRRFLTSDGRK